MPRKKKKKKKDKMPKIEALPLDYLSLSRVGIPAERLLLNSAARGAESSFPTHPPAESSWEITLLWHAGPQGRPCLKHGTDPSADIPQHAKYSSGLEQGFHEQEPAVILQTGAIPGDLGTPPLASLQKLLKKSISELSVVLLHLHWQLGWPIHNVSF